MKVTRQERGWSGHFICSDRCKFRRNTLLTFGDLRIVVSTVGSMLSLDKEGFERIGCGRYFETMAFHSDDDDERYHDADVSREIRFDSEWAIDDPDLDDKANNMHDAVVREISEKMSEGLYEQ